MWTTGLLTIEFLLRLWWVTDISGGKQIDEKSIKNNTKQFSVSSFSPLFNFLYFLFFFRSYSLMCGGVILGSTVLQAAVLKPIILAENVGVHFGDTCRSVERQVHLLKARRRRLNHRGLDDRRLVCGHWSRFGQINAPVSQHRGMMGYRWAQSVCAWRPGVALLFKKKFRDCAGLLDEGRLSV